MKSLVIALLCFCTLSIAAQDAERSSKANAASDFIRVYKSLDSRSKSSVELQTSITRYEKSGVHVDLIGAIHLADAKYYQQLNEEFTHYDALLFEMIGGERIAERLKIKAENQPAQQKEIDPVMLVLESVYTAVSSLLNLQNQKEGIDYSARNFVHADFTLIEFKKRQKEKGESIIGFALKNVNQAQKAAKNKPAKQVPQLDAQRLLMALINGDSNSLKREIVGTLGQGDDQVAALVGDSVIIEGRNAKCLTVLAQQVKQHKRKNKQKFAIFYGAAHFPDMEKRLLQDGYVKVNQRWLTAWYIPNE